MMKQSTENFFLSAFSNVNLWVTGREKTKTALHRLILEKQIESQEEFTLFISLLVETAWQKIAGILLILTLLSTYEIFIKISTLKIQMYLHHIQIFSETLFIQSCQKQINSEDTACLLVPILAFILFHSPKALRGKETS